MDFMLPGDRSCRIYEPKVGAPKGLGSTVDLDH